jgi:hypothetical protein
MNPTQQFHTFQTALQYGGSFFQLLGRAGLMADPQNKVRLLDAFPELTNEYGPGSQLYVGR